MAKGTCSEVGCDRPARTRGRCSMHYQRLRKLGPLPPQARTRKPTIERWLAKVQIGSVDECWPWLGSRLPAGYGKFGVTTGTRTGWVLAHRFAYEYFVGEIPPGMFICHHCDHPWCVNPACLFVGSDADNVHDMWLKDRQSPPPHGPLKTHCINGHEYTEANTYRTPSNGKRVCRTCSTARSSATAKKRKAERAAKRVG